MSFRFSDHLKYERPQPVSYLYKDIPFLKHHSNFQSSVKIAPYGGDIYLHNVTKLPIALKKEEVFSGYSSHITLEWLEEVCKEKMGSKEVANTIVAILQKKTESQIQNGLFEILGGDNFELMEKLIQNREKILLKVYEREKLLYGWNTTKEEFLSGISIDNEKKKKLEQKIRALERSITKRDDLSKKQKEEEEKKEKVIEILKKQQRDLEVTKKPLKFESKSLNAIKDFYKEYDFSLLEKTNVKMTTIEKDFYTELHVDPPAKVVDNSPLTSIKEFPEWARNAFKGVPSLNRIQTKCFPVAFKTSENMLICAPTGCGKTNVAMMTVLQEISKHYEDDFLEKDEFKILYVTPMKALANEIVDKFSKRLKYLDLNVREYTGDMRLSKKEIEETQLIVTTPEKWDVITRRQTDTQLIQSVRLIIFDEIHLLNDDRGSVIECLVARTLRQIEQTQTNIRLVGLSATLPNFEDVATFLRVNHAKGLFYFDGSFRPCPLAQCFIGVDYFQQDEVCFEKVLESIERGHQVIVFVHSRRGTVMTGKSLLKIAKERGLGLDIFKTENKIPHYIKQKVKKSTNEELKELFESGVSFHNAGMLRRDRDLVENLFKNGHVRVLCSTATLAWGVNLPAHTVIIKGTTLYNAETSSMVDLSILDVMQIFGRAGRPQFDKSGEGIIITKKEDAIKYLARMNSAFPIESTLADNLENHLNAEIVLGSVTNIREAIMWLTYTYLFVRIRKNPELYGIPREQILNDRNLGLYRRELIITAADSLDKTKMIRFNKVSETLSSTSLGRIASHYYIHHETIDLFNCEMKPKMEENDLLYVISRAKEFKQIKVRKEDSDLKEMAGDPMICPVDVGGSGTDSTEGKVNVLLQSYISRQVYSNFALISDCAYVIENVGRIVRALLEIALRKRWSYIVDKLIRLNKCIERRMWASSHPLRQFNRLSYGILAKLEGRSRRSKFYDVEDLFDMEPRDIDDIVRAPGMGKKILNLIEQLPFLSIETEVRPITRTILEVIITLKVEFTWTSKSYHSDSEPFWVFIEDQYTGKLFFHKYLTVHKKKKKDEIEIKAMIPVQSKRTTISVRVTSDKWLGVESESEIDISKITLPDPFPENTDVLRLKPLKTVDVLRKDELKYFRFKEFNPIQTHVFHTLYHTDNNVLIGASTGAGKTVMSELSMLRLFKKNESLKKEEKAKIVYIAPLKALVKEKLEDWTNKFKDLNVVELTGDYTPDTRLLQKSDIILTTPEKWDGITRNFHSRNYVQKVGLIIIDEVHLLGTERGSVLEVIISRARYISWVTNKKLRIVCLGTSLANCDDLQDWLGIEDKGMYNFKNSVRPVKLKTYIQGFSEKYYCPRMAQMNKPLYQSIQCNSGGKPVLVFVSSRRQTRLTALSIISFSINDRGSENFCKMNHAEIKKVQSELIDNSIKHTIQYGIGLHHSGLVQSDRKIVEHLFLTGKIQVIISTATLAWGVNLPAHLVIVKGTEFFDAKTKSYVQYNVTDILQMMGRAGRPQFDEEGVVSIFVQESFKDFYIKFLFESFPVESFLHKNLHNHINAEIVSGVIKSRQEAIDYLTWTFLFRRLIKNPYYYDIENNQYETISKWLGETIDEIVTDLQTAGCIQFVEGDKIQSLQLGVISSFYYVDYKTVSEFKKNLKSGMSIKDLLQCLAEAKEFSELPVRHNEDLLNSKMEESLPWESFSIDYEDPHVKTFLLFQAHFERMRLPITDYVTDLKSVLDQTVRVLNAYIDISANGGWLQNTMNLIHLIQMIMQGLWFDDNSLLMLPGVKKNDLEALKSKKIISVCQLLGKLKSEIYSIFTNILDKGEIEKAYGVLQKIPDIKINIEKEVKKNEIILDLKIERISKVSKFAYTPKFRKKKQESFWVIVSGDTEKKENDLVLLQRVSVNKQKKVELKFQKCKNPKLYWMCDSYIGIDQEYNL